MLPTSSPKPDLFPKKRTGYVNLVLKLLPILDVDDELHPPKISRLRCKEVRSKQRSITGMCSDIFAPGGYTFLSGNGARTVLVLGTISIFLRVTKSTVRGIYLSRQNNHRSHAASKIAGATTYACTFLHRRLEQWYMQFGNPMRKDAISVVFSVDVCTTTGHDEQVEHTVWPA